jgi:MarR family transcriptional regulator, transcriptional regulator for hemolysin
MLRRIPYNESRFLVNKPSGDPMARSGNDRSAERKHTPRTAAKLLSGNRKSSAAPLPEPNEPAVAEPVARQSIRLSFLIHDVSRMRRTAFDQLMRPLGVTRAQWWVLAHLSRNDGMTQRKLADALDVGKASVGTFLEKLEASGFIERRDDPIDKRAKRVYMARAGHQLLKQMTQEENVFNERILHDLSQQDRETMIRTLTCIKRALSEQIGTGSAPEED